MKRLINVKTAGRALIAFLFMLLAFHILIIFNIIPTEIIWGGKLENSSSNILMMEIIAITVISIFLFVIKLKINSQHKYKVIDVGVWIIFAYFLLNVFGNLVAESLFEKAVMAPIALVMALLSLRLAVEK